MRQLCVKAQFLRRYPSLAVAVNNANQRDLTGAKRGNGGTWGHPKLAVFFDALANSVKSTDLIESQRGRNCDVIREILVMLEELGDALSFEGIYLDAKGESRPCYPIPHREIEDMASELSLSFEQKVIDDILSMLEELEKDASSFAHIYLDAMNRSQTEYHLPRREVEILLTGYSIPLRAKVIDRLHELEEQAKGAAFRVPQSLPEALRLAAELTEQNEKLALENKEMAPKAVVFDNCMALRQESLATFVRTPEGVNTMAIKGDLADLGYLYRTVGAGKYRVYAKYRNVLFTEKLIAHPTRPVYEILPTLEGKKLIVQLYRDGKLTMKKAYAAVWRVGANPLALSLWPIL